MSLGFGLNIQQGKGRRERGRQKGREEGMKGGREGGSEEGRIDEY